MATKKDFKKIELPPKYVPKKTEPYMCPEQLAYFYHILNNQKQELMQSNDSVLSSSVLTFYTIIVYTFVFIVAEIRK